MEARMSKQYLITIYCPACGAEHKDVRLTDSEYVRMTGDAVDLFKCACGRDLSASARYGEDYLQVAVCREGGSGLVRVKEKLYYARAKLEGVVWRRPDEVYYNVRQGGGVIIHNKVRTMHYEARFTKSEWEEFGITEGNAIFEEVEGEV